MASFGVRNKKSERKKERKREKEDESKRKKGFYCRSLRGSLNHHSWEPPSQVRPLRT